jgi:hypothetical protein
MKQQRRKGPGRPKSVDAGVKLFLVARETRMREADDPGRKESVVATVRQRWGVSRSYVFDCLRRTAGFSVMELTYKLPNWIKFAEEERVRLLRKKSSKL